MISKGVQIALTAADVEFIVEVLARDDAERRALETLLADEDALQEILEIRALAEAIVDSPNRLTISTALLFCVLCRQALRGSASRDASNYVAKVLEDFTQTNRIHAVEGASEYFCDMLVALTQAKGRQAFLLSSYIGDWALFFSGLFAEAIQRREQKGAPGMAYFEQMGGAGYRLAASHTEARRLGLEKIYRELSEGFSAIRRALNELAHRVLHWEPPCPALIYH